MKKIRVAALLCLCVGLAGCGKDADQAERQQTLKQQGMELQNAGDYTAAIEKYEKALALADMEVGAAEIDLAYYKASAQYQSGDIEGALETYSAILVFKKSENTYLGRGLLYIEAGETEKGKTDLKTALEQTEDPLIRGIIYQVLEQTDQAKKCFEEAKEAEDFQGLLYLADIYEREGNHEYAMVLLEEYINSGHAGAEGYLSVGRAYFDSGLYEDALSVIQKGIALGNSAVLRNLLQEEVACYEKLGEFSTAKEKTSEYLEQYPEDAQMQREYEFLKSR